MKMAVVTLMRVLEKGCFISVGARGPADASAAVARTLAGRTNAGISAETYILLLLLRLDLTLACMPRPTHLQPRPLIPAGPLARPALAAAAVPGAPGSFSSCALLERRCSGRRCLCCATSHWDRSLCQRRQCRRPAVQRRGGHAPRIWHNGTLGYGDAVT